MCTTQSCSLHLSLIFFFNDTATTEIYTLSLHDALPICRPLRRPGDHVGGRRPGDRADRPPGVPPVEGLDDPDLRLRQRRDRKSTRLNSSHANISYAVFCLKKKKTAHDFKKGKTDVAMRV